MRNRIDIICTWCTYLLTTFISSSLFFCLLYFVHTSKAYMYTLHTAINSKTTTQNLFPIFYDEKFISKITKRQKEKKRKKREATVTSVAVHCKKMR